MSMQNACWHLPGREKRSLRPESPPPRARRLRRSCVRARRRPVRRTAGRDPASRREALPGRRDPRSARAAARRPCSPSVARASRPERSSSGRTALRWHDLPRRASPAASLRRARPSPARARTSLDDREREPLRSEAVRACARRRRPRLQRSWPPPTPTTLLAVVAVTENSLDLGVRDLDSVDDTPVAREGHLDRRLELDDRLTQRVRDLVRQHHVPQQVQLAAHDGIAVARLEPSRRPRRAPYRQARPSTRARSPSAAARCPRSHRSATPTRRHSAPRTRASNASSAELTSAAGVVTRRRTLPTESSGSRSAAAERWRAPGVHARPHQSRTRSASTCAVCTTEDTKTRSSTPWMRSACGPMQAAGIPEAMKARTSVVAVVGPVTAGEPATVSQACETACTIGSSSATTEPSQESPS